MTLLHQAIAKTLYQKFYRLKFDADIVDSLTGEIIIPYRRTITKQLLRRVAERFDHIEVCPMPSDSRHHDLLPTIQAVIQASDTRSTPQ